jgi:hypothetical protein
VSFEPIDLAEDTLERWGWTWEIEVWQMAKVNVYIARVIRTSTNGKPVVLDWTATFTRLGAVWWNIRTLRRLRRKDRKRWEKWEAFDA